MNEHTNQESPSAEETPGGTRLTDGAGPSGEPIRRTDDKPPAGMNRRGKVRRTRASAWWSGLIVAAILAVLLLVFIIQNSDKVTIHFLGFDGRLSLAVALLLAAVLGMLVIALPGAVRIAQLRHALKTNANSAKH